ncbi:MAG TPA: hypothetical protein VFN10_09085 [Thermoanaerobaculia bacterium]|nr:hypothetical protein [Thermoanaerobaculia bacterium]
MKRRTGLLGFAIAVIAAGTLHAQYNYPDILWSKRGHGDQTPAVRYSPDGQTLASGGTSLTANGGSVVLWNEATGDKLAELNHTGDFDLGVVNAIDFFAEGDRLVTAEGNSSGGGGSAARWQPTANYEMQHLSHLVAVPDGSSLDMRFIPGSNLIDVDVSPDGTMIAYGRQLDTKVVVYDADTGVLLHELPLKSTQGGGAVKFSPDGQYLAAGDKDGTVRVFNLADESIARELVNRDSVGGTNWFALGISSLAWTSDSTKLAVGVEGYGCGVRIWDVTTGARLQSLRLNYYFQGHLDYVPGDAYLGVGSTEWDYASQYNVLSPVNVRFINTTTGEVVARYDIPYSNPNDALMDFDIAPDGQTYAYGMSPGLVVVARNPYAPDEEAPPSAPKLTATATGTTEVQLTWTPVKNATSYIIVRSSFGSAFEVLAEASGTQYRDAAVQPNTTYLYKVRANIDGAPFSNIDAATTVMFTNGPLLSGLDQISREHIEQLRTCINAMRQAAGLQPASFTDPTLTSTTVSKAVHVQEIRDDLDAVRAALGLEPLALTDPTLGPHSTKVKAAHVQELRDGCM